MMEGTNMADGRPFRLSYDGGDTMEAVLLLR